MNSTKRKMVAKLGNFLVDIDTKVNDKGIKSLNKSLGGLARKGAAFGSAIVGATTLAGGSFLKLVKNTVNEAAELGRLSDDLGVTTEFLETFIRTFEIVGGGADEAVNAVRNLKKEVESFKLGKGNIEAFGILGFNIQDFGNDFSKNFDLIRKRFNTLSKEQRLYFIDQLGFGEKTLRILRLTDNQYKEIQKSARELGTLSGDNSVKAEDFARQIKKAEQAYSAFKRELIIEVAPAFTKFSEEMTKLFEDPEFRENLREAIEGLMEVLPKLIAYLPTLVNLLVKLVNTLTPTPSSQIESESFKKSSTLSKIRLRKDYIMTGGFLTSDSFNDWINTVEENTKAVAREKINELKRRRIEEIGAAQYLIESRSAEPSLTKEIEANVRRIQNIDATTNRSILQGNTTYNINVPVTRLGQNPTEEDILATKIADEIDRRNKQNADNFKSGVIQ